MHCSTFYFSKWTYTSVLCCHFGPLCETITRYLLFISWYLACAKNNNIPLECSHTLTDLPTSLYPPSSIISTLANMTRQLIAWVEIVTCFPWITHMNALEFTNMNVSTQRTLSNALLSCFINSMKVSTFFIH